MLVAFDQKNVELHPAQEQRKPTFEEAVEAIHLVLKYIGEDTDREGLLETPERVVRSFDEHFAGYKVDPKDHLQKTFEEVAGYQDIITLSDIPFESHCEHHMAPILGCATVSYLPKNRVVGISKIARVVDVFSKRLQTQEKLTSQICNAIQEALDARGVRVTIKAEHHCMKTRGVHKDGIVMTTSCGTGALENTDGDGH